MEDDGEAGNPLFDLFEDVEAQGGRDEHAVRGLGALLGLELEGAVRSADRNGERIHLRLRDGLAVDGDRDGLVEELDRRPPLQVLRELYASLSERDVARLLR